MHKHFVAGPPRLFDHHQFNDIDSNVNTSADISSIDKGIQHPISIRTMFVALNPLKHKTLPLISKIVWHYTE
jgi:hypothetical protein